MEIKFADVAHLYLGCDVQTNIRKTQGEGKKSILLKGVLKEVDLYTSPVPMMGILLENESDESNYSYVGFKPILRPLSELINERENTCIKLEDIITHSEQHCDAYDEWLDIYIDDSDPSRIMQAPFEIVMELIKQSYDVFGLIESGQAIDKTIING